MIRRKRSVSGTLDETRYVLKDYLDPVAIIDSDATVIERFGYDAFGPVQFMAADFTPRAASQAGWNFLFHAEFLDVDSGLYNYGYRYLDPQLGRWISRDPIGENGGMNLYMIVGNCAINHTDFLGLKPAKRKCKSVIRAGHGSKSGENPVNRGCPAPDKVVDGDRYTAVSCFSGDINKEPKYRAVHYDGEQFDDPSIVEFFYDNDTGLSKANPKEPGFLWPEGSPNLTLGEVSANQALQNAVDAAKKQAEVDCATDKCKCSSITVEVQCPTSPDDTINFPKIQKSGKSLCGATFTYSCKNKTWE